MKNVIVHGINQIIEVIKRRKEMDWYEEYIEEPIRPVVKLLRENGFNTECSCGHQMYVQCQYWTDAEIMRLDNLLINNGYENYVISIEVKRIDGHIYTSLEVKF